MPGAGYSPGQDFDADMPSGSTVGYDADNDIRDNQGHVDNAYAVEHYAPSNDPDASEDDFGRHDFITLKEQAAKPSLAGSTVRHALYAKAGGVYVEEDDATETLVFSFTTHRATSEFASTTNALFGQATSPTDWTKKTNWQDGAMIVINSDADGTALASGGSAKPQTAHTHTGGSHALIIAELAIHAHGSIRSTSAGGITAAGGSAAGSVIGTGGFTSTNTYNSNNVGSGTAHSHGATTANTAFFYQEAIWCTKD